MMKLMTDSLQVSDSRPVVLWIDSSTPSRSTYLFPATISFGFHNWFKNNTGNCHACFLFHVCGIMACSQVSFILSHVHVDWPIAVILLIEILPLLSLTGRKSTVIIMWSFRGYWRLPIRGELIFVRLFAFLQPRRISFLWQYNEKPTMRLLCIFINRWLHFSVLYR